MKTFRPIHQDRHHRSSRRKSTRKYERQRNRASKRKEGQRILAKIKPQSTVITLEIQGKMLSSEGLAQELNQRMTKDKATLYSSLADQTACTRTSYNAVTTHYHSAMTFPSNDAGCVN